MIEIADVTILKSTRKLFENLNFTIADGENWVIEGPNGSGKTLLLQLIAGTLHPFAGRVHHSFLEDTDWNTRFEKRREKIHMVPTHWLQAFLQGFDGLFYQQRYYTMDETELPTVRDVLGADINNMESSGMAESFNINALLDLHLTRLSNGQMKKVSILRQLLRNIPQLLLLDYPFEGLDAESRRDFITFIDDIATRFRIQVIMVDHGHTLPAIMNRRLVMRNFRIEKVHSIVAAEPLQVREEKEVAIQKEAALAPVVEMKDLTITYSGRTIISNLNWRINKGERWALTGKNGSGKTTLFSLIFADHPMAYSQKVFLFGKRRGTGESIWDIKKRINYLGPEQMHFLNPAGITFSAREYILMQPGKDTAALNQLIEFFNAEPYIDLPIRLLSSGQIQMVLLLSAFLDRKELLLLDEPFQFLDPANHQRVTDYLNRFLDHDITLVLITHDERDVARWTQLRKQL